MNGEAREATTLGFMDLLNRGCTIVSQPSASGGFRVAISDTASNMIGLGWGDSLDEAFADCTRSMEDNAS